MTSLKHTRSGRTSIRSGIDLAAEWLNDETWLNILEPALRDDPASAVTASRIWNRLIEMITSGEEGRKAAIAALEDALRLSYGFTEASKLALEHYRLYIRSGDSHPDEEPESILARAIERFRWAQIAEGKQKRKRKK